MNVLKQHLQSTICPLLERGARWHKIHELTGVDRKTIRRYQAMYRCGSERCGPSPRCAGVIDRRRVGDVSADELRPRGIGDGDQKQIPQSERLQIEGEMAN